MTTKNAQEAEQYLSSGDDIEFILQTCFHYVPARKVTIYNERNEPVEIDADEFWYRACILEEGYMHGTQGYLKVWLDDGKITTHHTYRNPGNDI